VLTRCLSSSRCLEATQGGRDGRCRDRGSCLRGQMRRLRPFRCGPQAWRNRPALRLDTYSTVLNRSSLQASSRSFGSLSAYRSVLALSDSSMPMIVEPGLSTAVRIRSRSIGSQSARWAIASRTVNRSGSGRKSICPGANSARSRRVSSGVIFSAGTR
jgi:hypothetical protein